MTLEPDLRKGIVYPPEIRNPFLPNHRSPGQVFMIESNLHPAFWIYIPDREELTLHLYKLSPWNLHIDRHPF